MSTPNSVAVNSSAGDAEATGRRRDGRAFDDLRPVRFELDVQQFAEGSAMVEFGNTRVLCAASVLPDVPRWLRGAGRGWVTAEYAMLPRATSERTRREVAAGRPSGRTQEIQRLIGRALRSVIDLDALGERAVVVDGRIVAYSGDSAFTRDLVTCALDADLFICDSTWVSRDAPFPEGVHMTGTEAGTLAADASVERLMITHVFPQREPEQVAADAETVYDGIVWVARDREEYEL